MMKKKKSTIILLQILLFLGATAAVVYFMPRPDEKRLIYEVNRPWSYSLLTAPFDIPVYLDSISEAKVRDSIDTNFEPVYSIDPEVYHDVYHEANRRLSTPLQLGVSSGDRRRILPALKWVYDRGVVDQDTYEAIKAGTLPSVKVIENQIATSRSTSQFLSPRMAYAKIDSLLNDDEHLLKIVRTQRLGDLLQPNYTFDSVASERMRNELYAKALAPRGIIQQGERIIDEGDMVTLQKYTILQTYENMLAEKSGNVDNDKFYPLLGQIIYIMIILGILYSYLHFFRPEYFNDIRRLSLIMLLITVFALFAIALNASFNSGIYIVPLTMVPIMIQIFLDSRTAIFCHLAEVMICALICLYPLEFIFMQLIAGVVAVQSLKDMTRRSQLIRAAFFVLVAYCVAFLSIRLIQMGSFDKIPYKMMGSFGINAVLVSFAYVMIFLLEKLFGFTSKVTLVELSDINNPVLRELSEECPGTFQHSMAVGNLASAAATAINANSLLVRAGALYHDIGKINNPAFFTENQHGVNPHSALDPVRSAKIITNHVTDGLRRAEKAKLPMVIRDFISQHHGRGTARYFYTTYCNQHPDEDVDVSLFSYPGPNPTTKETSILMMADAVEASSRSLKEHTQEAITELVNKIVDTQIAEGLHNDSPLSFRDVTKIKASFISRLLTMFHSRVSYPDKVAKK